MRTTKIISKVCALCGRRAMLILFSVLVGLLACPALATANPAVQHDEHGDEHDEHGDEHEEGVIELSVGALEAAALQMAPAELRPFRRLIRVTGELKFDPNRLSRIGPRIDGRIVRLDANVGDTVRRGQVLAELVSVELGRAKAEFLGRKAKLELARTNYDREKRLRSRGISSEKELLEAEAAQIEAQVELDSAESALHVLGLSEQEIQSLKTQDHGLSGFAVRAPLSGRVIERAVTLGEMAEPTTTLFVIADLGELWAQLRLYEKDLSAVEIGAPVTLKLAAFPDQSLNGTISYIADTLDETTRTAQARVVLKNPDGKLKPGMFLTASIGASVGELQETLAIPEEALQRVEGRLMVFVAEGERSFRAHEVQVGAVSGGYAQILSGLEPGAQIVAQGSFILKSELSKAEMGGGHSH